jgi:hypothetical protein
LDDKPSASYRPLIISLARDIVLNATVPVVCYYLSKAYISQSELTALVIATVFPILRSIFDLMRRGEVNPVSVLVMLGIATSVVALFITGDPRLLLIRESFFTGAFGLLCLFSLLLPRPMMFYFGRYFMTGGEPKKRKLFEDRWQNPIVRRGHRLITVVWGLVYLGEFILRVILVYTLAASIVLAVTPILLGLATIFTIIWTFRYAYELRDRGLS